MKINTRKFIVLLQLSIFSLYFFYGCNNFELNYMKTDLGDPEIELKTSFSGDSAILQFQKVVPELIIPDTIAGKQVVEIKLKGATDLKNLKTITIPDTVQTIDTFENCTSLEAIYAGSNTADFEGKLSGALKTLPSFKNCSKIKKIILPEGIKIEDNSSYFEGCSKLESVGNLDKANFPNGNGSKYIPKAMFKSCSVLNTVKLPSEIKKIGSEAFSNCSKLTEIKFVDNDSIETDFSKSSIEEIGESAFYNCSGLQNLTLGSSTKKIEKNAFYSCSKLTQIEIPENVEVIGDSVFENCTGLESIIIKSNKITKFSSRLFSKCSSLQSIEIPDSITALNESVFEGCEKLENIQLSKELQTIGKKCFSGCDALTAIVIPSKVTTIQDEVFYNCKSLSEITFEGEEPPELGINNLTKEMAIIVPNENAVDTYKEKWSELFEKLGENAPSIKAKSNSEDIAEKNYRR